MRSPGAELASSWTLSDEEALRLRRELERAVAALAPWTLADRREDLVQEAMLKVARIVSESGREVNATYLWRTAYCALVDELRRLRRRGEVALDETVPDEALRSPEPGPAARGESGEIRRALRECLGRLVEPRRLAVVLHLQGERPREAAALLGWPAKRVHNLTFRGLADLRRCLEGQGVAP